ncbi:MAG: TRAP transporter small permease subunit [Hyphomicrobiaceae bacterium]|nr:TRAP transporter small permease subunit [Hyphomicrobiaceae bacterium]
MGGTSGNGASDDLVHKVEELTEQHSLAQSEKKNLIDRFILGIGSILSWGAVILIAVIILQVVLRYGFRHGLVVLEEAQWHLYAIGVMFGLSFAQVKDSHIRVDILHMRLSERTQRIVEILGILFLLLPFCWVVFDNSLDFLADSWRVNESSDAPLGLCCRWGIKSVIPISIALLALAAISRLIHDFAALIGTSNSSKRT